MIWVSPKRRQVKTKPGIAVDRKAVMNCAGMRCVRSCLAALISLSLIACAGCSGVRLGGAGLALPPGNVERGRTAFRDLKCCACHSVSGHEFPDPYVQPAVLVVLGTEDRAPGRAELINAIINPSHQIYPGINRNLVQTNNVSRMPGYSEVLTVQQLCDLVAFLGTLHR